MIEVKKYFSILVLIIGSTCQIKAQAQDWSKVSLYGVNQQVNDLLVDSNSNRIYICGLFNRVDTNKCTGICAWDGNNMHLMAGGVASYENGFTDLWTAVRYQGILYVGGGFTTTSGAKSNYLERWSGNE